MSEAKTRKTDESVKAFLDAVPDERKRASVEHMSSTSAK